MDTPLRKTITLPQVDTLDMVLLLRPRDMATLLRREGIILPRRVMAIRLKVRRLGSMGGWGLPARPLWVSVAGCLRGL